MSEGKPTNGKSAKAPEAVGAVMVAGAGITGIQAALDLAESGFKVYLVEPSAAIGGRMAQLDKTFPTGDCAMCILSPKLVECARNKNIEIITLADIEGLSGEVGNFEVKLRLRPRYIDMSKCNACGDCSLVCPVSLPNEFDRVGNPGWVPEPSRDGSRPAEPGGSPRARALGNRKAVFRPYAQAIPNVYGISKAEGMAPCKAACPAGVNAQGYVALIGAGKFEEAYELVKERCPLPAVCGRICQHPCESQCNRKDLDEPVAVRDLKRFAADFVYARRGDRNLVPFQPAKLQQERVAIIGGGPAGLTAAQDLTKQGYGVTIFEARPFLGGMLRLGVPAYRLPRDVLDYEIEQILNDRIEVQLGQKLGKDFTIDGLKQAGYAAVFVATGAHKSQKMGLPGDDAKGVMYGLDFLGPVNLGEKVPMGGKTVVVGGGNVAMDAARAALRMGSQAVTIVYRRSRVEMPALPEELAQAEEEGVSLELLTNPIKVVAKDGRVTGLECLRMQLGEPDASGRRRPVPVEGSNFTIAADHVIIAIGQTADLPDNAGVPLEKGKIAADGSLLTSVAGVFAGGDVVLGPASLVEAMAHGHHAAEAIHAFLRGQPLPVLDTRKKAVAGNPNPAAESVPKQPMPKIVVEDRTRDFREIETGYTAEQAMAEAKRCLACGLCSECGLCSKACAPGAIVHDMQPKTETIHVGSVILTPGYEEFQASLRGEFGHGRYANVLSSVQFERMLSASGPTEGHVQRPSDGKPVKKLAFIQCVGSRDSARGNGYCSSICCMSATKEAMVALEHVKDLDVSIFCMDVRAFGKEFDGYVNRARDEHGVKYIRAMPSRIVEMPGSKNARVRFFDDKGRENQEEFDLVVLSVGLRPSASVKDMAARLGLDLNQFGFCQTDRLAPMAASKPGIYVAGAFQEPKDIPESVAQASGAAACAMEKLAPVRGTMIKRHEYPWERDVTDEKPRIGIFICHCGHNIASVVDVKQVAAAAAKLPGIAHAETNLYACSDTSQQHIKTVIREKRLNRLVVASCSPRTHEVLFQETLRESGLNQYLFAMTNIRDQCSWVHKDDPEAATCKATDLMRMAVARARNLKALSTGKLPVVQSGLVIGGGLAGMTCALALGEQGFAVHLLEKADTLGGQLRHIHSTLEGADVAGYLAELVGRVQGHPKISVHLRTTPVQMSGHVGNFKTVVESAGATQTILHGVLVLAVGGSERQTDLYLNGKHPAVMTQRQLEEKLHSPPLPSGERPASVSEAGEGLLARSESPTVVMIQCVDSRNEKHPYCSRVCCSEAIKNALELKHQKPKAKVIVLYRDIRTYGFRELAYEQARKAGVLFIRYNDQQAPVVSDENGLQVTVTDASNGRELAVRPDLVVLSTGIAPAEDNPVLSGLLRTALTADGFFLEAHPKLRPVDLANEGEFIAGLCHSPRFMDETIAHAKAVAGRAATILSRAHLDIAGQVAKVDPTNCVACATCVKVCPYGAPMINDLNKAEIQTAKCMGCGSCTAACPAHTITLQHQECEQLTAMLDELLVNEEVSP
jgi:heterodisulfide reductase subunit A-like polyferredoxin